MTDAAPATLPATVPATSVPMLLSGIGGQGIQLGTALLAAAAVAEGHHAMYFGAYGGMMRGGNSETTLVLSDAPVRSTPTVGRARAALVLHPDHAASAYRRIDPHGVLLVNTALVENTPPVHRIVRVDATGIAGRAGNPSAVTMAAVGAFAAATRVVALDTLLALVPDLLPPYRRRHVDVNREALRLGHAAATGGPDIWKEAAAWTTAATSW